MADQQKPAYDLDEILSLIRELPEAKKPMVLTIIQKTLESANISPQMVLKDISKRIAGLKDEMVRRESEIEQFKKGIADNKQAIASLAINLSDVEIFQKNFVTIVKG